MTQTVDSIREYLDEELNKVDDYKLLHKFMRQLLTANKKYSSEGRFKQLRNDGVGSPTISKFLGGNWNMGKILRLS